MYQLDLSGKAGLIKTLLPWREAKYWNSKNNLSWKKEARENWKAFSLTKHVPHFPPSLMLARNRCAKIPFYRVKIVIVVNSIWLFTSILMLLGHKPGILVPLGAPSCSLALICLRVLHISFVFSPFKLFLLLCRRFILLPRKQFFPHSAELHKE